MTYDRHASIRYTQLNISTVFSIKDVTRIYNVYFFLAKSDALFRRIKIISKMFIFVSITPKRQDIDHSHYT